MLAPRQAMVSALLLLVPLTLVSRAPNSLRAALQANAIVWKHATESDLARLATRHSLDDCSR